MQDKVNQQAFLVLIWRQITSCKTLFQNRIPSVLLKVAIRTRSTKTQVRSESLAFKALQCAKVMLVKRLGQQSKENWLMTLSMRLKWSIISMKRKERLVEEISSPRRYYLRYNFVTQQVSTMKTVTISMQSKRPYILVKNADLQLLLQWSLRL